MTTPDSGEPTTLDLHGRPVRVISATPGAAAFWRKVAEGRWETDTFEFIDRHVSAGTVFIDIGAWIGPITLYAAPVARQVIALEPDPVAWASLERNVALNPGPIELWHAALGLTPGELELFAADGFGRSVTSALGAPGAESIRVPVRTFDDLDQAIPPGAPIAVKVDIEGYEYELFDALLAFVQRRGGALHLSLHPRNHAGANQAAMGLWRARLDTWRRTWRMIERLGEYGRVTSLLTGRPVTRGELFRRILLRGRPKNFSVEVAPA